MSEIPFVKSLGDAIERSAAERIAGRRRRIRRRLTIGVLGFAVAATGVAAASGVFNSPVQLASSGVACYDRADLEHANVSVLPTGQATPIETCRRVLHTDGPLVACAHGAVLVFPGGPGTCEKLDLAPLPADYEAARKRVNRLGRRIMALERSADCWAPEELAARVQALLDRAPAWRGWNTTINRNFVEGPCGVVSHFNGDGSRSIDGAFDPAKQVVMIFLGTSRSMNSLLLTPDSPGNRLLDASGERCYTVAGLEDLARERLAVAQRPITFEVVARKPGVEITDAREARLDEGCAVIVGVRPTQDDRRIVVEIWE